MTERKELERRASNGDAEAMVELAAAVRTDLLHELLTLIGECDLVMLSEEIGLLHLFRAGDEDALQRLVESRLRSVITITKDCRNQGLPFLDLISVGVIGCVCAIWACRETPDVRFHVAETEYIRDAVLLALETSERRPRNVIPDGVEWLCASISGCAAARGMNGDSVLDPVEIHAILVQLSATSPAIRLLTEMDVRQDQASTKADEWLSRAAELGSSEASDQLAGRARTAGDLVSARALSQQGADAGHVGCMIRLAQLAAGEGDAPSERGWYERAAEADSIQAMLALGLAAQRGGDTVGCRGWYERAAEAGSPIALFGLGHFLVEAGDLEAARPLFARSAGAGYNEAFAYIGQLERLAGNREAAESWWLIAIGRGETNSMKLLAEVLEEGEEPELAREWYTTAALLGDAEAMFELSVRCERVGQDDEARYWLTRAAANEWKDAQKKRDAMG